MPTRLSLLGLVSPGQMLQEHSILMVLHYLWLTLVVAVIQSLCLVVMELYSPMVYPLWAVMVLMFIPLLVTASLFLVQLLVALKRESRLLQEAGRPTRQAQ